VLPLGAALAIALALGAALALGTALATIALATALADALGAALADAIALADAGADASVEADDDDGAGAGVPDLSSQAIAAAEATVSERSSVHREIGMGRRIAHDNKRAMHKSLVELIAQKRDGGALAKNDLQRVVDSYMSGELADYQMAAFLMAVFFRGMNDEETVAFTEAMLHSGEVIDLSSVPGVKVDKHSTGGVGDKVSICLAPIVAACGVPVPMVSGRGLGHTGGTLDKLEAIASFRTDLSVKDFARIVRDVGVCMIGQTKEIAPADKRIYALRDVTATVECVPLIVASILSKKLAEGIDALVLDVKVGRGAFMKDLPRARELAQALVRVGTRAGKKVVALLTDMESPLGETVGNAIETREALAVLRGGGPADLVECTMRLAEEMIVLGGRAKTAAEARVMAERAIASGDAARVMQRMIEAQSGDPRVVDDTSRLEVAKEEALVLAPRAGYITRADALEIGLAGVAMGAGRTRADQKVDPAVGILLHAKPGAAVEVGEPLARLFVRDVKHANGIAERVQAAFAIEDSPPNAKPLVLERLAI
jgi:pyrimidine-nucleoside phosphorylase